MTAPEAQDQAGDDDAIRARVDELLSAMTPAEKAGQLTQYFSFGLPDPDATVGAAPQPEGEVEYKLYASGIGTVAEYPPGGRTVFVSCR